MASIPAGDGYLAPRTSLMAKAPTSIRLHSEVFKWAKREAKKRGVGYQTVINEFLLAKAV